MDDYLIRHYKAKFLDELNAMLENGKLSKVSGSTVVSEQILPGDCNFRRFNYWRINRTDLWVDIALRIELKVQTETGIDTDFVWFSLTLWYCASKTIQPLLKNRFIYVMMHKNISLHFLAV